MSNEDKIDDTESTAQTLKPKATAFSQRPTIPIPINKLPTPWYERYLHLIIIILSLILICEIIFITHIAKSKDVPKTTVTYDIPVLIDPPEQIIIPTPDNSTIAPEPKPSATPIKPNIKTTPIKPKDKDYGINDGLIDPFDKPIIYSL